MNQDIREFIDSLPEDKRETLEKFYNKVRNDPEELARWLLIGITAGLITKIIQENKLLREPQQKTPPILSK